MLRSKASTAVLMDQMLRRVSFLIMVLILLSSQIGEGFQREENVTSEPKKKEAGSTGWQKVAWVSLGARVCAGVGAIEVHKRANEAYNNYRQARTEQKATEYRKETQSKDRLAIALLTVSAASFVVSGFAFLRDRTIRARSFSLDLEISPSGDVALVCRKSF